MENKENTGNKLREYLGEFAKFSETFDNLEVPVKGIHIQIHLNKLTFSELNKEVKLLSRNKCRNRKSKRIQGKYIWSKFYFY